ncbi:MAG: TIGR00730 family Rossman fold protein [Alphaproteobacteria bacterium HGW-Alphaproteobacteria-2]|nr:MAG: TIGR00730 family Rossman fold protein [Alphaproteobacteria bacterium HGW-Alphaproteobacteria-2]
MTRPTRSVCVFCGSRPGRDPAHLETAASVGTDPRHLVPREKGRADLTRYVVTETMHERKKVMFMNADAVVTLAGGPGSLDELFEVLTWRQLGLHAKPIYLMNAGGYWDPLLTLIDHMIAQGFAEPGFRDYVGVVGSTGELAERLRADLS